MTDLKALKKQYSDAGITRNSVAKDPFDQFKLWFGQACDSGLAEPNGFSLSTLTADSRPTQRTVLMKSCDADGFVFYTNHHSRKGQHLIDNPQVSMLFPWYELHRQINIEGSVTQISDEESSIYFSSRPRGSQIGAWASHQSAVLTSREVLLQQQAEIERRFGDDDIPLPSFWGGYKIKPVRFEFWQGRTHRLHDRIVYNRSENGWQIQRLSP